MSQELRQVERNETKQSVVRLNLELRQQKEETVRISLLINSVYYFIESVFIAETSAGYRLSVTHHGAVLTDEIYKTLKGARIGFTKRYGHKAWEEGVKPHWTPFYPPEKKWLKEKLQRTGSK
jgi:hypothetical protein